MTAFPSARQIRIFDYPRFAEPLRDRLRERAAELAAAAGITIEHIANSHIRKEEVVAKVLAGRGDHPGLVHVISAMEACPTYKPWHSKETHRTFLRPATGKCLLIGQGLRPLPVVDAHKGVVGKREADPGSGELAGEPAVPVAIELQAERTPGRDAQIDQAQLGVDEVEVIMQALTGSRAQESAMGLLAVPGLVGGTR